MAVPKLRFKEFDGDWFQSKIGEIFQVTSGSTPLRSDNRFFENADIVWVKTTDLNNGLIEKTEEKISQIALKETSVKILPKGTVFVAMYGGFNQIGRTGLLVHEAACNQALSAIYPNEKIDSYFLLTFLNHKVDDWKNFAASSRKDPNITKSDVLAFPLKYPVKEEQTKIASFLSAVDEKISQLTQKHQLLSQYKQGMMQKLFSQQLRFKADDGSEFGEWEERKLSEISQKAMYGMNAAATEYDGINKYLRITDICEFSNSFKKDNLTSPNAELFDRYKLQLGDLLFARTGASVGKSYLYREDDGITYFAGFLIKFSLNTNLVIPYFIFLQTLIKEFCQWVVTNSMRSGQPGINAEEYSSYIFKVPCLEEQTKIANFLSSIDQKIEVVAQQIEQAKTWKKGLLQQMFV